MPGVQWLRPGDAIVDFSFQPPAMSTVRAMGYQGIIGYLPWDPTAVERGCLNLAMIQAVYDNGLAWASVWELNADRALGGWAAGTIDGNSAVHSHRGLGGAPGSLISCAIDFDANPNTQPAVLDYAAAFSQVVEAAGFSSMTYGGVRPVDAVMASRRSQYAWQAEAWSYGQESAYLHIIQRIGSQRIAGTDHCDIYKPVPFTGREGISTMAFSDDPAQQSFTDKVIIGLLTAPHPQLLRDGQPSAPALADIYEAAIKASAVADQVAALRTQMATTDASVNQLAQRVDQLAAKIDALPGGGGQSGTAADLVRELIAQLSGVTLPPVRLGAPRPVSDNTGGVSAADLEREAVEAISYGPRPPQRPMTFGPSYPFSGSPHRPFTPA